MRAIGFDMGTKRVGVALSDGLGMVASPLEVHEFREEVGEEVRYLADLARAQGADIIVVGMPISLRGEHEIAAQKMQVFVEELQAGTQLPVVTWDERMTTAIAQKALIEGEMSREKRKDKIDSIAAAIMLQSYLDAQAAEVIQQQEEV